MHGAIAAGHPLTAEAGARTLEAGGSAVDACLAAAFVSWVAESPLTGPGGGGFMLVHTARDDATRLLDFFVTVPGPGLAAGERAGEMDEIDVQFAAGGSHAGVPHRRRVVRRAGRRSRVWRRPTARTGRCRGTSCLRRPSTWPATGVELTAGQAYLHAILDVILRAREEGQGDLRARTEAARGRRPRGHAGSRRHARAPRAGGRGRALRRRARPAPRRPRARGRRHDHDGAT